MGLNMNMIVIYDTKLDILGVAYASAFLSKKKAIYMTETGELIETHPKNVIALGFL